MKKLAVIPFILILLFLAIFSSAQDCSTLYGAGYKGAGSSIGVRSYNYASNTWGSSLESTTYFTSPNTIKNGGPIAIDPLNQNINFKTDNTTPTVALFTFGNAPTFVPLPTSVTSGLTAQVLCSGYKPASHVCYYMTTNYLSSSPTPAGTSFFSVDFTNPASPVGKVYTSSLATGSPFLNTSSGGDICFDANGRGYIITSGKQLYTVSIDETANTAVFTYIASLSGLAFAPTAIAFDPVHANSLTITGASQSYTNYNLSTNTLNVLTTSAGWIAPDLASCVFPNMNPSIKTVKTFYDVTQSLAPPVTVATGDIIQYTITVTNTGNENAGGFTMADAIPAGTTYVAGSTTMNGSSVSDISGNFPFATAKTANSNDQSAGSGILSTNSSSGSPTCVIKYSVKVTAANNTTVLNSAYASVSGLTSSTPITATGNASFTVGQVTLPVTLLSFTAAQDGDVVMLDWVTSDEVNNSRFEIERSAGGSFYSSIGTAKAAPLNGDPEHFYHFTDMAPALGNNYYRLKQIDLDGNFAYSPIRNVDFNNLTVAVVKLFPNPVMAQQKLTLSIGQNAQQLNVRIMNSMGQTASIQNFNSVTGSVTLETNALSKGVYYIIVIADEKNLKPVKLVIE
jgi:uncharacterized repeat protein (TIGR01451 family)